MRIRLHTIALGAAAAFTGAVSLLPAALQASDAPATVSFDRDIRGILSDACFKCHGPDEKTRVNGIRLDTFEGATAKLADGKQPFVPGNPGMSEAVRRMSLPDSDPQKMPPVDSNKKINSAQVATIKAWVAQGAKYETHWAFTPVTRPAVPAAPEGTNPIDAFVLERLKADGIGLSPEADKRTLVRRVALDLTGLPPTSGDVDRFLADDSKNAYDKMVDRFLANPHYGEKMALGWLDLARYADTHGYHIDSARTMYRWRDWVIDAYNKNLPYDQFLTWQLAGDLLPNPTHEQLIATGFNRNHPINYEGGAIPEEYQVAYVADRVDTTATAVLGLTMRCAQCHDHKYEPITQKDYYKFFAYFNNIDEAGLDGQFGNAKPFVSDPYPWQTRRLKELEDKGIDLKNRMAPIVKDNLWPAQSWKPQSLSGELPSSRFLGRYLLKNRPTASGSVPAPRVVGQVVETAGRSTGGLSFAPKGYVDGGDVYDFEHKDSFSFGAWVKRGAGYGSAFGRMDASKEYRGWDLSIEGDGRVLVHLINKWPDVAVKVASESRLPMGDWAHVAVSYDGSGKAAGLKVYIDGKAAKTTVERDSLMGATIRTDKPFTIGRRSPDNDHFSGELDDVVVAKGVWKPEDAVLLASAHPALPLVRVPEAQRTRAQRERLAELYCLEKVPAYATLAADLKSTQKERDELAMAIPNTMVMKERAEKRKTFLLSRGAYDKPTGEELTPSVPSAFQLPGKKYPANRLGLAQWMTDPANPLVARVAVNRIWQTFFGTGIVKTVENLGVQGEWPTHRRLLDWLSTEYVRIGWDTKKLVKLILTSRTYKQVSEASPALMRLDPENELLGRAPRLRLKAEILRDQALSVSGLLVPKIGGPSVRPYQPKGLWEEMSINPGANDFSAQTYVQDHGENLYRRGMYTFWKRTVPPPSMQTLDAPEREFCVVRRSATNTPLQALVLMNDPVFVEAARKLAERVIREGGKTTQSRVDWLYRQLLCRSAEEGEAKVLEGLLEKRETYYKANPEEAAKLLKVGEMPADTRLDAKEVAAWTVVCNTVLNTDEVLNRN